MKLVAVVFFLAFVSQPLALACMCWTPLVQESYARSDAVFAGVVTAMRTEQSAKRPPVEEVVFSTISAWKGIDTESVLLHVRLEDSCAFRFALGDTYLVYATHDGDVLQTNICMRTRLLSRAEIDLSLLPAAAYRRDDLGVEVRPAYQLVDEQLNAFKNGSLGYTFENLIDLVDSHELIVPELTLVAAGSVNDDRNMRRLAVQILGSYAYHARPAVPVLLDLVCSEDLYLRATAIYALQNVFPECHAVATEYFESRGEFDAHECARVVDKLRMIELTSLPPDSLRALSGRIGRGYMVRRHVKTVE